MNPSSQALPMTASAQQYKFSAGQKVYKARIGSRRRDGVIVEQTTTYDSRKRPVPAYRVTFDGSSVIETVLQSVLKPLED